MPRIVLIAVSYLAICFGAAAETFDEGMPEIDALVSECLDTPGVGLIGDDENVACFNAAIFPSSYLEFAALPETPLTVITSPGGHVITARLMAGTLDERSGRVVIADQCASACAMMLTPAIEDLHIHRTAHFAVHGITSMTNKEFYEWEEERKDRKAGGKTTFANSFMRGFSNGLGFSSGYYSGGRDQFKGHLKGQDIDGEFQNEIGAIMLSEAEIHDCRYPPGDYWGLLDADYLRKYLGDQISVMEDFVQTYDHSGFEKMRDLSKRIGSNTYVFEHTLDKGGCK